MQPVPGRIKAIFTPKSGEPIPLQLLSGGEQEIRDIKEVLGDGKLEIEQEFAL